MFKIGLPQSQQFMCVLVVAVLREVSAGNVLGHSLHMLCRMHVVDSAVN